MRKEIAVKAQYLKDLSFESPKAPTIFGEKNLNPKIDISVDLNAKKIGDKAFEVAITLTGSAAKEKEKIFLIELIYAGIFVIEEKSKEELEKLLLINCPFVLFPFARRIVAEITREGGFPPLMIDPIDFEALYENKKSERVKK